MPTSANFRITAKPTFKDLRGRFARAEKKLVDARRAEMRDLGRTAVQYLQDEAPKRTGTFAAGIRYQTRRQGTDIVLTTSSPQPLGRFITGGTRAHEIVPRGSGYPLRFIASDGTAVFTYHVNHPGTKPNPYHERAWSRLRPQAVNTLRRISTRYTKEISK